MTTVNQAKFTINGTPSVDPVTGDKGYEATLGATLTLTLEENPSSVLSVTYSVYDSAISDSPLASKDATTIVFNGSGASTDSPVSPNGTVTITMPGSGFHSYNIRCVVSTTDGPEEYVRQVDLPTLLFVPNFVKTVPEETTEYYERAWSDKINDMATALAGIFSLIGLDEAYDKGGSGLGRAITADSGAVAITVPDTSNNAGMIITQSDVTNNPNALELSNAGTGSSIALQGAGTRDIYSDDSMSLTMAANSAAAKTFILTATNAGAGVASLSIGSSSTDFVSLRAAAIGLTSYEDLDINLTSNTAGAQTATIGITNAGAGTALLDINVDDAITIDSGAAGIALGAPLASSFIVSNPAEDLTFGARGATITLNELGETTLHAGFTATSVVGCLNELVDEDYLDPLVVVNAATHTFAADEMVLFVTYTDTGACTVTIPSAEIAKVGRKIVVKDAGLNASVNNITIATAAAETIEEQATAVMNVDGVCLTMHSDGSNLYIT